MKTINFKTKAIQKLLLVLCLILNIATAWGQSLGDYRSIGTGNWTTAGTWEYYNGSTWITPSTTYPGENVGAGSVEIQSGHTITLNTSISVANAIGSLSITGGTLQKSNDNTARGINITGNFSISSGTLTCAQNANRAATTITIGGDYIQSDGTVTETSSHGNGVGNFILNKSGSQNFIKTGGTISNTVNFTVNSGSILVFDATSIVNGAGTFTLSGGAGIITANLNGLDATGSVQTSSRSFSNAANYTFNGAGIQVTGSYMPTTVNHLTINNSFGVNLSNTGSNHVVNGDLLLSAGIFNMANSNLTFSGSSSCGTGTLTNTALVTLTGSGNTNMPSGSYANLTINRTGGAVISLCGAIAASGTLTLTSGVIQIGSYDITIASTGTVSGGSTTSYVNASSTGKFIRGIITTAPVSGWFRNDPAYVFPIGDASCYAPVSLTIQLRNTISVQPWGTALSIGAQTFASAPASTNGGSYLNRYWQFSKTGTLTGVFSGVFTYGTCTTITGTEANLLLKYRPEAATAWAPNASTVNTGTHALTSSTTARMDLAKLDNIIYAAFNDPNCTFANVGPGGVGNASSNVLWLKGDGTLYDASSNVTTTDNTIVSRWDDASGNYNNAFSPSGNRPLYRTNIFKGNPAIQCDGDKFFTGCNLAIPSNSGYTNILVFTENPGYDATGTLNDGNGTQIIDRRPETNPLASFKIVSPGRYALQKRNDAGTGLGGPVASSNIIPYTITVVDYMHNYNVNYQLYINGTQEASIADADGLTSLEAPNIGRHSNYVNKGLIGYIGEFITYNYNLNTAQLNIVNSYLAAKYSITVANLKYNFGTVYGFDVAGIGREDASNQHTEAVSANILQINNASALGNGDYLMWGHDNGSIAAWSSDGCPSDIQKVARTWRFSKTGTVGTVDVSVDLASFPALPPGSKYILMIKSNNDFTNGARLYEMDYICGSTYKLPQVIINDGDFMTIGVVNPKIQFTLTTSSVFEYDDAVIEIGTNFIPRTAVTVDYYTTSGSATQDADYTGIISATATIPANSQTTTITIDIINDVITEDDENFTVTLSNPIAGYTLGVNTIHTVTIHDDDNSRKIYFSSESSVGSESITTVQLTVSIDPSQIDHFNETTVDYYVSGGTGTGGGVDYTLNPGTATIPVHEQSTTIEITVVDDGLTELVETILVTLTNPLNGNLSTVNPILHTYSILDNDIYGYEGPGGVGNSTNNRLWLMADAGAYSDLGSTLALNNTTVQQWNDLSGNSNHAFQNTPANRPTFKTNIVNSKPALQFNAMHSIYPGDIGIASTDGFTYFTVVGPTAANYTGDISALGADYIIDRTTGTTERASLKFVSVTGIGPKFGFQKNPNAGGSLTGPTAPNTVIPTSSPITFSLVQYYRIRGQGYYITTNGNSQSSIAPDYIADTDGDLTPPIPYIGGYQGGNTNGLIGDISEFIVYNGSINSTQRLIVDNYLSVKYGIVMSDVSRRKYAYGATFPNELAGIGKLSANSFHNDARGSGIVRINNPNKLDDDDFMFWGHDGAVYTMTSAPGTVDGTVIAQRMTRRWKVDINGNADGVGTTTVSFDFTNTGLTISDLPYFLLIDRDNDGFADNDVTPLMGITAGNIVTFSNVTFQKGDIFSIGNGGSFSWTGNTDNNWSNPNNWSTLTVPLATSSITIPASRPNYPELISSSPAICANIDIQSGAWVTIPVNTALVVNNLMDIGGTLTIKSDATGTGTLIDHGITQTGTVNVERYITDQEWHYLGLPVDIVDRTFFNLTNFYYYDETVADKWDATHFLTTVSGWTNAIAGNLIANYGSMKGYTYLYYETVLNFTGTLNTGNQSTTLRYTDNFASEPQFDGWNLIGNPYPSGIDWDLVDKTNIDAAVYYYDDATTGSPNTGNYHYYVSGGGSTPYPIGVNDGTRFIPQMQGFFVRASNPSKDGTIFSLDNSQRAIPVHNFYKNLTEIDYEYIRLKADFGGLTDETIIRFLPEATNLHDKDYDAYKMFSYSSIAPRLFSKSSSGEFLAINSLPVIDLASPIPLCFIAGQDGDYTIIASEMNVFDKKVYLLDAVENITIDLTATPEYKVYLSEGEYSNRFSIIFGTSSVESIDNSIHLYSYLKSVYINLNFSGDISGSIEVFDTMGKKIITENINNQKVKRIDLNVADGVYIVKVTCNKKVFSEKIFVSN